MRTFFYPATSNCDVESTRQTASTTGDYSEGGSSSIATEIDITNVVYNDLREQERHDSVIPRSFDIYYIENNLLYYGDYDDRSFDGSSESERPIVYDNASVASYLGSDTSDAF